MNIVNRRRYMGKKEVDTNVVDLGLPSGTLWAKGNICKDSQGNYYIGDETERGCYFAWGEIEGYNDAAERNVVLNRSDGFSSDAYIATGGAAIEALHVDLTSENDAASVNIQNGYRMPRSADFKELINNCTFEFAYYLRGVRGALCAGPNGKQIFLPCSTRYNGNDLGRDIFGYYWSSTYYSFGWRKSPMQLTFWSEIQVQYNFEPYTGLTIRPVK